MSYWEERMARAQGVLSDKNISEINKQMKKYYRSLASQIVNDFEATYDKLLTMKQEGKVLSTADLYRLDRYWEMEAQLQERLKKLHDKSVKLLTNEFKQQFKDIYNSLQFKSLTAFTTIDDAAIDQLIKQVWCADGKSWSQRIWENTQLLQQTLNDELVHCVVTGQPTGKLKKLLQERFNVAYSRSDCLVRTEIAHIQKQHSKGIRITALRKYKYLLILMNVLVLYVNNMKENGILLVQRCQFLSIQIVVVVCCLL